MDGLQVLKAFARALEVGSFSAVGRELGTSQSTVSKQIATLEESLGVQLFARTTRRLNPTAEALQLHEHVRQLLDALDTIKAGAPRPDAVPRGLLRLTAPTSFGRACIVPQMPEFLKRYPEVSLDLVLTDRVTDLVEEGFELAIRAGNLPSSSMIARSLGLTELTVVGAPSLFEGRRPPEDPLDLPAWNVLIYTGLKAPGRWEFESENGRQVTEIQGSVRSNDLDAIFDLCLRGLGLAALPDYMVDAPIRQGRLRPVLDDYYLIPLPVNVIYPQTRFLTLRARCFIDFLIAALKRGAGPGIR
ncbi:LysR family transcriptional regulator [Zavarzinia compransoris]|uniref:LysR family transcriptional regulator n=1 Tax=Zavarzinia compransoris TaxID=1264899 RepID=A0A317DVG1_9PROT|nr:LysR family transcriptional regulator [Zavarzinia compransoris]PWR18669.1 LysR family transcriptional regulator [Zavarzinia compransoris]TDP40085.1 LysR family transcriptional regulator [Zavarzinia compransoris]